MKRNAILLTVLCFFAVTFARVAAAQDTSKIAGNWTATIHTTDKTMTEQWMIKQDGAKISGTIKNDKGELPLSGTLDGSVIRALVTDGDNHYQVHLNVDGTDADGTIRMGKNEFLIMLKKK
jgi:phage-related tail fiber protein